MKKSNGFSLIELLVVIAILGILASVATTAYRTYVLRAERTEAQSVLVKIADAQEKYYLNNNRYADQTELASIFIVPTTADENINWTYVVTPTNNNQQFTATATRPEDTECSPMTIESGNNLGTGSWNSNSSCN